eukprot:COSAG01_NODE_2312_length_7938_cov_4.108687_10_plen_247_part_00
MVLSTCFFMSSALVNTEKFRSLDQSHKLQQSLSFNTKMLSGNKHQRDFSGYYRLDFFHQNIRHYLIANLDYGKSEGLENTNNAFLHARAIFETKKRYDYEAYAQYEYDRFLDLEKRVLVGCGIRAKLTRFKPYQVYSGFSVLVELESNKNKSEANVLRLSQYITFQTLLLPDLNYSSTTYIQPALSNLSDFRVYSLHHLNYQLKQRLSCFVDLEFRYNHQPVISTHKRHDIVFKQGFRLSFNSLPK